MTLDHIKTTEESLIDELRRRFKGKIDQHLYEDDLMFRRFLRARNHNLDATETMLKNHLIWRKQYNIDRILTDFVPNKFLDTEYFTLNRLGFDLEGSPLSYVHFGCLDTKGVLKSATKEEVSMYLFHFLETDMASMKKQSIKTGKEVSKCVYIFNWENFSLATVTHKQTIDFVTSLISIYDGNFPERLKCAYAINASYYFTVLWSIISKFMSPATRDKVKMYGKTGWQEDILQTISPDVLPAFLGGNITDPDGNPLCKTIIKYGGPVPEKYFMYSHQSCQAKLPGSKKLHIQRMSKAEVTLHVLRPDSNLEWEIVLKNKDIAFSIWYKKDGNGDAMQIVPQQRVAANSEVESGVYLCEKTGIYIIEFDNTYSWLHSKEIFYTATVTPPCDFNSQDTERP